jgi:hypothetical protein
MLISHTAKLHDLKLIFELTGTDATSPQSIIYLSIIEISYTRYSAPRHDICDIPKINALVSSIDTGRVYYSIIYFFMMFKIFARK